MLLRNSKSASFLAYPVIAAVTLFLVRNRQITQGGSPGSGVSIVGAELLVRASAIMHWAVSVGAQGFSLLLRVATAPLMLAVSALQAEFRFATSAIDGIGAFVQHAAPYLLRML